HGTRGGAALAPGYPPLAPSGRTTRTRSPDKPPQGELRRSSTMRRYRSSRTGFTLIELLVVIAIIAILAAILFPVFARAREKARQTTCTSNLRQISTALMLYVQDYDEKFPALSSFTGTGTPHDPQGGRGSTICTNDTFVQFYGWALMVQPYLKNLQ